MKDDTKSTLRVWAGLLAVFLGIPVLFGWHIKTVEEARSPENNGYHCWTQSKSQGSDVYYVCVKNLGTLEPAGPEYGTQQPDYP